MGHNEIASEAADIVAVLTTGTYDVSHCSRVTLSFNHAYDHLSSAAAIVRFHEIVPDYTASTTLS